MTLDAILGAYGQAWQSFGQLWFLLIIVAGAVVGLTLGIIPGLSGMIGMALVLPFIFMARPEVALTFMIAMHSTSYAGGSITAIILNIPGTPPSAATLLDGYPMTLKGEGGRALGAALTSCGVGSIFPALLALIMVPLVIPMIMAITSADMFFLVLLGITFIAVLGTGSMIKGLISGGLGLLISFVGFQPMTGVARFTFGSLYLYEGLALIPLVLGLFALPEMIDLTMKGGSIAPKGAVIKGRQVWEGMKDVYRHRWLCLRSSIIGYVIGIIPGIGGVTAPFVAYGQAKQLSKHPEKFGTGIVEGVIAPESANDAKEAGALLTTLALGIPGSASMVILLGGMLMVGLTPGPDMLTEHLSLSLTLLMIVAVAGILEAVIPLLIGARLAKIATIPGAILVPLVLVAVFAGAFAYQQRFNDIITLVVFGVVGLAMKSRGYSRPALVLGYVLGFLFEKYFFLALRTVGPLFFLRPISLTLIFIIIALFAFGPIKGLVQHWSQGRVKKV